MFCGQRAAKLITVTNAAPHDLTITVLGVLAAPHSFTRSVGSIHSTFSFGDEGLDVVAGKHKTATLASTLSFAFAFAEAALELAPEFADSASCEPAPRTLCLAVLKVNSFRGICLGHVADVGHVDGFFTVVGGSR